MSSSTRETKSMWEVAVQRSVSVQNANSSVIP